GQDVRRRGSDPRVLRPPRHRAAGRGAVRRASDRGRQRRGGGAGPRAGRPGGGRDLGAGAGIGPTAGEPAWPPDERGRQIVTTTVPRPTAPDSVPGARPVHHEQAAGNVAGISQEEWVDLTSAALGPASITGPFE